MHFWQRVSMPQDWQAKNDRGREGGVVMVLVEAAGSKQLCCYGRSTSNVAHVEFYKICPAVVKISHGHSRRA